jgi:hypothetical protein
MKTIIALLVLAGVAIASAAIATPPRKVTDAEVQRVIDERLHEMLVKLNSRR